MTKVKRGDIFYANLEPVRGSEQGGTRPVLIIQNDIGNQYSPTVIIVAITTKISKPKLPTHIGITPEDSGVTKNSVILCEQIRTIDKQRLSDRITHLTQPLMQKVDYGLKVSLGLTRKTNKNIR